MRGRSRASDRPADRERQRETPAAKNGETPPRISSDRGKCTNRCLTTARASLTQTATGTNHIRHREGQQRSPMPKANPDGQQPGTRQRTPNGAHVTSICESTRRESSGERSCNQPQSAEPPAKARGRLRQNQGSSETQPGAQRGTRQQHASQGGGQRSRRGPATQRPITDGSDDAQRVVKERTGARIALLRSANGANSMDEPVR